MASLNRVQLIGNVGRDAELRYTQSGQAVASFSVATSERVGEGQERTEWHNVTAWAKQAEIAGQYVKKGRQIYVEGRLQTRDWTDPQGVKHYKTEIVCQRFLLLGGSERAQRPQDAQSGGMMGYDEARHISSALAPANARDGYSAENVAPEPDWGSVSVWRGPISGGALDG